MELSSQEGIPGTYNYSLAFLFAKYLRRKNGFREMFNLKLHCLIDMEKRVVPKV
jgi:hypothetical protein